MVSGRISGVAASGQYAAYLDQMIGFIAADVGPESGLGDGASINAHLLDQGLAEEHADDQIPVFYWCGKQTALGDPVILEIFPTDPTRGPRFGWDTRIDIEYNLPGLRSDALTELEALIGFKNPELDAVPPIERGFTWVKWPTWFWVKSSLEPEWVFVENDVGTFRLEMRAKVDRVEWTFGGKPLKTCTPDQMVAYNGQAHDPVADAPACSYWFDQTVIGDLQATIYFDVQERILRRNAKTNTYPDTPWQPHPDDPELELTTIIPDYGVHEIYSVNTPIEMTDDEIAELLRSDS